VTHADAIIGLAIGAAAIVCGVGATEFYALGPGQRPKPPTKTISRWFGQLWCFGIGALLIFWSLPNLRGSWHWHDLWDDWWLVPFVGVVCVLNLMLSESGSEGEIQSLNLAPKKNDDFYTHPM
jgi:hypothetical protein